MSERLLELIRAREAGILDRWSERTQAASPHYRDRPLSEIRESARGALRVIRAALERGDGRSTVSVPVELARACLSSGSSQAETLAAFLAGRETLRELIQEDLEGTDRSAAAELLDSAFHATLAAYVSTFCSLCHNRQDERRIRVERQLESMIDSCQDGIVLFDDDLVVHGWNPGAVQLFGYTEQEALGRRLDRLLSPDRTRAEGFRRLVEELRERGQARDPEALRMRKDRLAMWVDESYTAVRDSSGRLIGYWAIYRDISRRRELEEEKLQAERLALVGTMSAKLAHEVRNPLNSLVLGLDLIRDNLTGADATGPASVQETRELITSVESEIDRIQRVVEEYLHFAHLPRVQTRATEFDPFLRGHLELVRPEARRHRIGLEVRLGAHGARLALDEGQLWQAILNIVRNSFEAMPDGGKLRVTTSRADHSLVCEIEDTGVGMSPEVRRNIYRPFFSTKPNGTGLGMPLAQQILLEHGAALDCESEPGKGTRFRIVFPLDGALVVDALEREASAPA